ncbi:MAG: hypothetical protein SFH39_00075 [Candidatus Magnetobacterium sp. LHC-1]
MGVAGYHMTTHYTKEEIEYLKNNYENMENSTISKHINRSVESIRDKAKRMGLRKLKEIDIIGKRFNNLVVTGKADRYQKFECICDCGNTTITKYQGLRYGTTKSCGCLRKQKNSRWADDPNKMRHKYSIDEIIEKGL